MRQEELYSITRALLLAGGVVSIVVGGVDLLFSAFRPSNLEAIRPVLGLAVGIIALATLNEVKNEAILLVLIVLGLISGNAGGDL